MTELQQLAQSLAMRLQRPVAIDDPQMHLLAHTAHDGPLDAARLDSLVRLQPSDAVVAWARGCGIARADAAVRLPASSALGLLPRVCAPIRANDLLLGYVVIIDADQSLTDEELRSIEDCATTAAHVISRDQLLGEVKRGRQHELLRDLLSEDRQVRCAAAVTLIGEGHLANVGPFAAVAVQVTRPSDEDAVVFLEGALQRVAHRITPGGCIFVARADEGALVVTDRQSALRGLELRYLGEALRQECARASGGSAFVGIGQAVDNLESLVASLDQARRAIRVAQAVPGVEPTAMWRELGVYRVLAQLPLEQVGQDVIHPGLLRLFEHDAGGHLVRTLETYLDHAGDVRATIGVLIVHRTTLYYRLARIEELGGFSLGHGGDRLAVHVGLKLARLAGLYPASAP